MKKKVLAFVLVAAMAVSLVGCAGNTTSGNESSGTDGEADTNTLYIGVAAPITGDMAETGVMMDVASRMCRFVKHIGRRTGKASSSLRAS